MKQNGFSLLEVLVALFIGAMIMAQLLEGMRQASLYFKRGVECAIIDRTVALMFNQLERDLTAAFIPYSYEEEKKEEKKEEKTKEKNKEKSDSTLSKGVASASTGNVQKDEQKPKPTFKKSFLAQVSDEEIEKKGAKKRKLLSLLSFITTTQIEMFGEQKVRLMRVGYQLKETTDKKAGTPRSYSLLRKETCDCENAAFKESDENQKDKKKKIVQYVIAQNIKTLSIEFSMPFPKKEDGKKRTDEEKEYSSFEWGEKEVSQNMLPYFATISCEIWDPTYTKSYPFTCSIPIFAFPSEPFAIPKKIKDGASAPTQAKSSRPQNQENQGNSQPSSGVPSLGGTFP